MDDFDYYRFRISVAYFHKCLPYMNSELKDTSEIIARQEFVELCQQIADEAGIEHRYELADEMVSSARENLSAIEDDINAIVELSQL